MCLQRYSACKAHAPYYVIILAPTVYPQFFHIINGTIFEKKLLNMKCVFWFSLQLLSETFLTLRRIHRYIVTNVYVFIITVYVFTYITRCCCQILIKLELSGHIIEKYWNIKYHENPSSWTQTVVCGQTDMRKLTVAFRNFANAPNNENLSSQPVTVTQTRQTHNCQQITVHTRHYIKFIFTTAASALQSSDAAAKSRDA